MSEPLPKIRLGIDIGGTSVKAAVFSDGQCVRTGQSLFYARPTTAELTNAVRAAVGPMGRVDAIGLCVPGLMNADRTRVLLSINVPGLVGVALDDLVGESLGVAGVRTSVFNDATATAIDVARTRALTGRLLVLALGTGVGGAVLDDGVPLDVEDGTPGHLGQIDVSVAGHEAIGPDGSEGVLEAYIGVPALRRTYGPDVSAAVAAFTGDEPAVLALVRVVRIAHAIYRPDHVRLCGGIGTRLRHLLPRLRRAVDARLTTVAKPGWTLDCGDDDFHAARGAAVAGR